MSYLPLLYSSNVWRLELQVVLHITGNAEVMCLKLQTGWSWENGVHFVIYNISLRFELKLPFVNLDNKIMSEPVFGIKIKRETTTWTNIIELSL